MKKYRIKFDPIGKSIDVVPGTNLLEAAWLAGISISSECGGFRSCRKCRVIVIEGEASTPESIEADTFTQQEIEKGFRLACCAYPMGDLKLQVPEKSLVSDVRLQVNGLTGKTCVNPRINSFEILLDPPSLEDQSPDLDRIKEALTGRHGLKGLYADIAVLRHLSDFIRQNAWKASVFIRSQEIIGLAPPGSTPAGLAVDLGTTKIAAYLMDLTSGKELVSTGSVNPQTAYGEDVMTRLQHAAKSQSRESSTCPELTKIIRDCLNNVLERLIKEAGISDLQIVEVCIVGNTAMTHLLLGLPVRQLAAAPYISAVDSSIEINAHELGLKTAPGCVVYIPPSAGGFAGSDHVSMILAADIERSDKITLGIDIGTNTEIVLHKPVMECLAVLSCPSGPAFEGAHISDGMRAAKGAIETVKLTETGVEYRTIGDTLPIGLCGSGIIDLLADLYRWGIVDHRGRFQKNNRRIRQGKDGPEFLLVPCSESKSDRDIAVTQKDIDEILLAKGSIRAGIEVLFEETGTTPESVENVIIAGAFGSYINIVNAVDIGMLPNMPNAMYRQIGNGAGAGAKKIILSVDERKRAEDIASKTSYIELTAKKGFNRRFAEGINLPFADNY